MEILLFIIQTILRIIFGFLALLLGIIYEKMSPWYFKIRDNEHPALFIALSLALIPVLVLGMVSFIMSETLEGSVQV